ncbi:MAG: acyl carrier protein [Acidobacteria bacterium]|nr:MAG: acyl carrier protein [Acidobacteriota bacterium]
MELVSRIEEEYGLELDDESAAGLDRIADLFELVRRGGVEGPRRAAGAGELVTG